MAKSPRRDTATEALQRLADDLSGSLSVEIVLDGESSDKLIRLAKQGRDLLRLTVQAEQKMVEALMRAAKPLIARGGIGLAYPAVGQAWLDVIVARVRQGGLDVAGSLRELKPKTIARKGHAMIGRDSDALLDALEQARVIVRRRR